MKTLQVVIGGQLVQLKYYAEAFMIPPLNEYFRFTKNGEAVIGIFITNETPGLADFLESFFMIIGVPKTDRTIEFYYSTNPLLPIHQSKYAVTQVLEKLYLTGELY
jgi:hypothetical protein